MLKTNIQKFIFIFLPIIVFSCNEHYADEEQKVFNRIEFVFNLKKTIETDVWKSFTDKQYEVPLIYVTDTNAYVANPTNQFLVTFHSNLVFTNGQVKIYKTEKRIDSLPFHMETGMTLGTPTDDYNYHSPFMKCSSFEITQKTIPKVKSTEHWATMIMHEYFHGFQYKHAAYLNHYEKNIVQIQPDSLNSMYKKYDWFKEKIDIENNILLQALQQKDSVQTNSLIDRFFKVRTERRELVKQKLNFDISNYEKCYETMEGTARYVEYSLYHKFSISQADTKLIHIDTSYKSYLQYKNYDIQKDQWLFMTSKTTYFYAIGFNMARLLDKLKIEYKTKLFNQGDLSLEDVLKNKS
jgi:hypothetical protein